MQMNPEGNELNPDSQAPEVLPALDTEPLAREIARLVTDSKGLEVVAMRVLELVEYTDYFVVCSARSDRHARAIYDHLWDELAKEGKKPLSSEGVEAAQWILVDYGSVVVHIFFEPVREFYGLERLWADAPRLELPPPPDARQSAAAALALLSGRS